MKGGVTLSKAVTVKCAVRKTSDSSHISPQWESGWARYTAGSRGRCERRRAEMAAGEPSGPFGPPLSSVSLGSGFSESGPECRSNQYSTCLGKK